MPPSCSSNNHRLHENSYAFPSNLHVPMAPSRSSGILQNHRLHNNSVFPNSMGTPTSPVSPSGPQANPLHRNSPSSFDDRLLDTSDGKICRPMNTFILFRSDFTKVFGVHSSASETSVCAGLAWGGLTPEQKIPYQDCTRVLREQYNLLKLQHLKQSARKSDSRNRPPSFPYRLPSRLHNEVSTTTSTSDHHISESPSPSGSAKASSFRSHNYPLLSPSLYNASEVDPVPELGKKDESLKPSTGLDSLERDQQFGLKPQIYHLQSSSTGFSSFTTSITQPESLPRNNGFSLPSLNKLLLGVLPVPER
ncbi:Transcription factor SOX-7, partial [Marasmius crinis-equi]